MRFTIQKAIISSGLLVCLLLLAPLTGCKDECVYCPDQGQDVEHPDPPESTFMGIVELVNRNGRPISGGSFMRIDENNRVREIVSFPGEDGQYLLLDLPQVECRIRCSAPWYETEERILEFSDVVSVQTWRLVSLPLPPPQVTETKVHPGCVDIILAGPADEAPADYFNVYYDGDLLTRVTAEPEVVIDLEGFYPTDQYRKFSFNTINVDGAVGELAESFMPSAECEWSFRTSLPYTNAMAWDEKHLFISNRFGPIHRYTLDGELADIIDFEGKVGGLAWDGESLWCIHPVYDDDLAYMCKIDLDSGAVERVFEMPYWRGFFGLGWTGEDFVLAKWFLGPTILERWSPSGELLATEEFSTDHPGGITCKGDEVWFVNHDNRFVYRWNENGDDPALFRLARSNAVEFIDGDLWYSGSGPVWRALGCGE